jgi:PAS domain S-box-containing protein
MARKATFEDLEQRIRVLEEECAKGKQAAEGLVKERDYTSAILDTAGALVVVLDREGRITRFNRACEQVTGYSAAAVSGRVFWEFLVQPEELQGVMQTWKALQAGNFPNQHENRWVAKNGSRRIISWTNTAVVDPRGEVEHIIATGIDITERNQAEEELQESERKYRSLVNSIPDVTWTSNSLGETAFISPNVERIYGYTPEEIVSAGEQLWFNRIHPEDIGRVRTAFDDLFQNGKPLNIEYRIQRKDGTWIWLSDRSISAYSIDGTLWANGVFSDITERKRAEELILQNEEQHRAILQTAMDGFWVADVQGGRILEVNDTFCRMSGYSEEELGAMHIGDLEVTETADDITIHGRKIMAQGEDRFESRHRRKDGSILEVEVSVQYRPTEGGRFVGFFRDITERKRAETALRESESRYRTLFEGAQDGMAVADAASGILVDCNQALCRLVERERTEIVGQPQSILHPPEILVEGFSPSFREHQRDPSGEAQEENLLTKSGKIIPVEIRGSHISMAGRNYMMGVFRDMTERKQAEEALRRAERQLKLVFDAVPAMIWQKDRQGRYVQVNKAHCQTTGLSEGDFLGKTDHELYAAEIADQYVCADRRIHLSGEAEFGMEEEYRKPSGEQMWWRVDKLAYRETDDQIAGTIGFALDITEEKKVKEVLQESEEKFRFLAENMADMVWTTDLDSRTTYVSPSIVKILGFSPEERKQQSPEEKVTPESLKRLQRFMDEVCDSKAIDSDPHRSTTLELECYRKDGSTVWIENNMKAIRDHRGSIIGILGVSRDITDRKRAEKEALNRKNTELNSFINNIPDLAWIKDSESNYIAANKAFAQTVGMTPEYLINNPCEVCFGEDAGKKFREEDRKVMESKRQTIIEEEVVDSQGKLLWLETIKSPILDDSGNVVGTVGIARDITERRRAKEVLEQSERKLRLLSSHLLSAHETERERISKELHDQLGQDLIGLKLHVGSIQRELSEGKIAVSHEFESVKEDIDQIIENVRRLSRDLGPYALEHLGLWQALRYLTEELTKHYLVKTSFEILSSDNVLPQSTQLNIFRVFQEVLTNIQKHADAARVSIEVGEKDGILSFLIEDDGKGFDLTQVMEKTGPEKGLGLVIMEERIRILGGVFDIWSQKGKGTRISFTVPVDTEGKQG